MSLDFSPKKIARGSLLDITPTITPLARSPVRAALKLRPHFLFQKIHPKFSKITPNHSSDDSDGHSQDSLRPVVPVPFVFSVAGEVVTTENLFYAQ
jgi:hypothetical protein